MRVLFSGMDWFPVCRDGGLDRYFFDYVTALASERVEGTAIVSNAEACNIGDVRIRSAGGSGDSTIARCLGASKVACEELSDEFDLVNSHFALYTFPWLYRIPKRTPVVVNFHGPWAGEMRAEARSLRRYASAMAAHCVESIVYRRAHTVITLSEAFKHLLQQRYRVRPQRIKVVPGGVDLERYLAAPSRADARRRLDWPTDRPVILSVRRLAKRMGLEALIDAVGEVRQFVPNILLLIGGKGKERVALESRIQAKGLSENVRLLGFIPEQELHCAYAAADLSIVPSMTLEGFGLITVESLAAGTPVLGTPVGGTPEILYPLAPQLVFSSSTPDAIADRLRRVLTGEITLPAPEQCRNHILRYGWPKVLPQLMSVHEETIRNCR